MMVCLLCVGLPEGVGGWICELPGISCQVWFGFSWGSVRRDGMGWDDGVDGWLDGSGRGERGSIRSFESLEVELELELSA